MTRYALHLTNDRPEDKGVTFQLNRVAVGPVGCIDPFTGQPTKPKVWKTRRGAERRASELRQYWKSIEVVEVEV